MRPQIPVVLGCLASGLLALCSCSSGNGPSQPRVSTTPPPIEQTVAAGANRPATGRAEAGTPSVPVASMPLSASTTMPLSTSMPASTAGHGDGPSIAADARGPHEVAAPDVDGCNRSYGTAGQCIPVHAPGGGPLTCSTLALYHYLPLLVSQDPLGLLSHRDVTVSVRHGRRYLIRCAP